MGISKKPYKIPWPVMGWLTWLSFGFVRENKKEGNTAKQRTAISKIVSFAFEGLRPLTNKSNRYWRELFILILNFCTVSHYVFVKLTDAISKEFLKDNSESLQNTNRYWRELFILILNFCTVSHYVFVKLTDAISKEFLKDNTESLQNT